MQKCSNAGKRNRALTTSLLCSAFRLAGSAAPSSSGCSRCDICRRLQPSPLAVAAARVVRHRGQGAQPARASRATNSSKACMDRLSPRTRALTVPSALFGRRCGCLRRPRSGCPARLGLPSGSGAFILPRRSRRGLARPLLPRLRLRLRRRLHRRLRPAPKVARAGRRRCAAARVHVRALLPTPQAARLRRAKNRHARRAQPQRPTGRVHRQPLKQTKLRTSL